MKWKIKYIDLADRKRMAREVLIGAPAAAVLWLLLLRVIFGVWSWSFPLWIVMFSVVLALFMHARDPIGSLACGFWRMLIRVIDRVVTTVVCAVLYYLLFTPLGWLLRLLRVRLIDLRPDPGVATYWKNISPAGEPRRHYFRQF